MLRRYDQKNKTEYATIVSPEKALIMKETSSFKKKRKKELSDRDDKKVKSALKIIEETEKRRQAKLSKRRSKYLLDKPKEIIDNVVLPVPVLDLNLAHLERLRKVCEENPGIKGKQIDIKEGFIYCLSNPAWPEWVKVGETIDYESRLKTYQTSSPMTDYKMFLTWWVEDRKIVEKGMLDTFKALGYEVRGEWVKISTDKLYEFLNK